MALGRTKLSLMLGSMLALGFSAGLALSQMKAPTADKGLSADKLQALDLGGEISSVKGRPLRMRKVMLLPGGVIALHSHEDLPAVSYLMQGEVTYHQEGKAPVVVRAGESIAEGKNTAHWAENRAGVAAVWIVVDVPKE